MWSVEGSEEVTGQGNARESGEGVNDVNNREGRM